jgi:hypothetical protein
VAVLPVAGRFVITDGHKRFSAFRPLAGDAVVVEVWGLRRLAADLWQQSRVQQRRAWSLLVRAPRDPGARREAAAFLGGQAAHLGRIARSLWAALGRGRRGAVCYPGRR